MLTHVLLVYNIHQEKLNGLGKSAKFGYMTNSDTVANSHTVVLVAG